MIDVHDLLLREVAVLTGEAVAALARVTESAAPRAARERTDAGALDPGEAIHDLRVALRRLRSIARPMRLVYGKRTLAKSEARLRAILDLTSELRDEEVLRETLGDLAVDEATRASLAKWMEGRARRERGLRARATKALTGRGGATSDTDVESCLAGLREVVGAGAKRPTGIASFRRAALAGALEDLETRVAGARIEDTEAMHRVRIGAKRLRYVAELVTALEQESARRAEAPSASSEEGADLARASTVVADLRRIEKGATRLQKRLGQLHDLDEALARMSRAWGLDAAPRGHVLEALRRARAASATKSEVELRDELERIRATSTALLEGRGGPGPRGTTAVGRSEDAAS